MSSVVLNELLVLSKLQHRHMSSIELTLDNRLAYRPQESARHFVNAKAACGPALWTIVIVNSYWIYWRAFILIMINTREEEPVM